MILKPPSCRECPGWGWTSAHSTLREGEGFLQPSGTGSNGVALVGEAAGKDEAQAGLPFVGAAGHQLDKMLAMLSPPQERSAFIIDNVLRCRPPNNDIWKMQPYERQGAIDCCAHFLDHTLAAHKPRCIVAMGAVPMGRLLDAGAIPLKMGIEQARGYVFWSTRYGAWVIPTYHPSYLQRGMHKYTQVWIADVSRALEIARSGFAHGAWRLHCDPAPGLFHALMSPYMGQPPQHRSLAYDIETPRKAKVDEDNTDLAGQEPITRISFAYSAESAGAVSVPWTPAYLPTIKALLASEGIKLVWNAPFDNQRLEAEGITIIGPVWDMMYAWHVLNCCLPKKLGYVAPFYCPTQPIWKHKAEEDPAAYNATDSRVLWAVAQGIVAALKRQGLYDLWQRYLVDLYPLTERMRRKGVRIDAALRASLSQQLAADLAQSTAAIQAAVPVEVRGLHPKAGYKKPPTKRPKAVKDGAELIEAGGRWWWRKPFVPSLKGLKAYQAVRGHRPVMRGKGEERRATFDERALRVLLRRYKDDPLYPLLGTYRETEKNKGTFVDGLPVAADGRVHTTFTDKPYTLRFASQDPDLQNIPRPGSTRYGAAIRNQFIASEGCVLVERDYKAIEAQLVGYLAHSRDYLRLAKLGVHDYLASHLLGRPADLAWSDEDLRACFKEIKQQHNDVRDIAKRCVHACNYLMGTQEMCDLYPSEFPTRSDAARVRRIYFESVVDEQGHPLIPRWHLDTLKRVEHDGYLRTPFGFPCRFFRPFDYKKVEGKWRRILSDESKDIIAFGPQSTAAFIIREAMWRLRAVGWPMCTALLQDSLILQNHDALLLDVPAELADDASEQLRLVMEAPLACLPLDPTWGFGTHLAIETEDKRGERWGEMQ